MGAHDFGDHTEFTHGDAARVRFSLHEALELYQLIGCIEDVHSGDDPRRPNEFLTSLMRARDLAALLVLDLMKEDR